MFKTTNEPPVRGQQAVRGIPMPRPCVLRHATSVATAATIAAVCVFSLSTRRNASNSDLAGTNRTHGATLDALHGVNRREESP